MSLDDVAVFHIWNVTGSYVITAKAEDEFGNICNEATKTINKTHSKTINNLLFRFLESHPYPSKYFN